MEIRKIVPEACSPYANMVIPREWTETIAMGYNKRLSGGVLETETHNNEEEIYIVMRGEGILVLDGVEFSIAAGEAAYIPRDKEHGIICTSEEPLEYLFVANWPKA